MNKLRNDRELVSGVTEALVRDHRTDVAVVGITDRDGVITLESQGILKSFHQP